MHFFFLVWFSRLSACFQVLALQFRACISMQNGLERAKHTANGRDEMNLKTKLWTLSLKKYGVHFIDLHQDISLMCSLTRFGCNTLSTPCILRTILISANVTWRIDKTNYSHIVLCALCKQWKELMNCWQVNDLTFSTTSQDLSRFHIHNISLWFDCHIFYYYCMFY